MFVRTNNHYGMGWRKDSLDSRDFVYAVPVHVLKAALPAKMSLRKSPFNPPIYDQGEIGSCTCNATARLVQFTRRESKDSPDWVPSRLLMYYDVRVLEGSVASDSGAELRDVIKTLAQQGVCNEAEWPYNIAPANSQGLFPAGSHEATKPSPAVYLDARLHLPITYSRVQQTQMQMKGCLVAGFPFMFGFTVYSSIYDANGDPVIDLPMPDLNDDTIVGGHAVTAVGYDDTRVMEDGSLGAFEIANSWGTDVQDGGYFYMPYAYMDNHNLVSDLWTVRKMTA